MYRPASWLVLLLFSVAGARSGWASIVLTEFTATVVDGRSVQLHWTTASEPPNIYGFYVQKSQDSLTNYQNIPGAFEPGTGGLGPHSYNHTDTSATPGKWYYRLKQQQLDGTIHYSSGIPAIILNWPQLLAPEDGTGSVPENVSLVWSSVEGAVTYHLLFSDDPLFASTIVNDSTVTDTARAVGPLTIGTTYYWRVRSGNASHYSLFSPVSSFSTFPIIPGQVALVFPPTGATISTLSQVFSWQQASPAVTAYWFELAINPVFTESFVDSNVTSTSLLFENLQHLQTYWWRVRARNISGWGPFSEVRTFVVNFTLGVQVLSGWNMISNPVSTSHDSLHQLYPTASPPFAFAFEPSLGYVQRLVLERGRGYWAKFPAAVPNPVSGNPVLADSFAVNAGWNMIGSISVPVPAASITSIPSGIIAGQFYGYNGTITAASTIEPGKAYWVKVNSGGVLILSGSLMREP